MTAAYPIGWLVSHMMLAVIYYLVITPMGLVARMFGWDPIQRSKPQAKTNWVEHRSDADPSRYFRQS